VTTQARCSRPRRPPVKLLSLSTADRTTARTKRMTRSTPGWRRTPGLCRALLADLRRFNAGADRHCDDGPARPQLTEETAPPCPARVFDGEPSCRSIG
jgi:hypothetical protein